MLQQNDILRKIVVCFRQSSGYLCNFHHKYIDRRRGRGQEFYLPLHTGLFLSVGAGEREKWKRAGKDAIFLEYSAGTSAEERWNFKILPTYSKFDKQLPNLLSTVRLKTLITHGGKIALSVISKAMYLAVCGCKSDVQQFLHPTPLLRHRQHHNHQRNLHAPFSSGVWVERSSSVWVKIYWQELLVPRSTT